MKGQETIENVRARGYLDERDIFAFGFTESGRPAYLFAVCGDKLTAFESDVTYAAGRIVFAAPLTALKNVRIAVEHFGLRRKVEWTYNAVPYKFYCKSGAGKFISVLKTV